MRTLVYQVQPTAALFILWPSFLVTDEFLAHYFLRGKKGDLFSYSVEKYAYTQHFFFRITHSGFTFDHVMHRMLQSFVMEFLCDSSQAQIFTWTQMHGI